MRVLHINGMTPPALTIAIALHEKGLAFEVVEHDWADTATVLGQIADGQLELTNSLEGEFPILVDGEDAMSNSLFILEYLDDRYPEPALRPADAYGQWRVQAIGRFLGERALPGLSILGIAARGDGEDSSAAARQLAAADLLTAERRNAWQSMADGVPDVDLAEARRNATLLLDRIETMTKDGVGWLLGENFTLTDVAAFALVHALLQLDKGALAQHPGTRAWHDRVASRQAVRDALALQPFVFLPGPELSRWG